MRAVHDHAEPRIGRFQRRRDRAGLAARQRAHRVEEMREAGEPLGHGGARLGVGRHRMTEADPDAGARQLADEPFRRPLGRERDHGRAHAAARRSNAPSSAVGMRI